MLAVAVPRSTGLVRVMLARMPRMRAAILEFILAVELIGITGSID